MATKGTQDVRVTQRCVIHQGISIQLYNHIIRKADANTASVGPDLLLTHLTSECITYKATFIQNNL